MTEAAIVNAIVRWLKSRGAYVVKTYGSIYRKGMPDLLAVYQGRALALEVKRPGGKPTRLQLYELGRLSAAGAIVGVVTSVEDVKRLLGEEETDGQVGAATG